MRARTTRAWRLERIRWDSVSVQRKTDVMKRAALKTFWVARSRMGLWLALGASLLGLSLAAIVSLLPHPPSGSVAMMGAPAPDFQLEQAGGGQVSLREYSAQRVLLCFVNTQSDPSGRVGNPSRGQVVFLTSMARQYRVNVVLVDATRVSGAANQPDLEAIALTWHLDGMPLLEDPAGTTSRQYGVRETPTTFLIRADGRLAARWDGFVPAQVLAGALTGTGR
jgi:peroxiredoxin